MQQRASAFVLTGQSLKTRKISSLSLSVCHFISYLQYCMYILICYADAKCEELS